MAGAAAINWKGAARKLEPGEIDAAAQLLGCEPAALKAVLQVEAKRTGYDGEGRLLLLFEPHIFFRELPANLRGQAEVRGLASRKWGAIRYGPTAAQYGRIDAAMTIDRTAALRSASYGLGQIMGFNHVRSGYENVEDMVTAMKDSENAQLMAMVAFIKASRLDDELARRDWVGFARGYNGPAFARNHYDEKLRTAYRQARGEIEYV